jgi:hypothetical protein
MDTTYGSSLLGDWIVRGALGELYPVRSDVFAASYEGKAVATDGL